MSLWPARNASSFRALGVVGLALATGFICVSNDAAGAERLSKGPYLQELGATSVNVRVETDAPTKATLEVTLAAAKDGGAGAPITVTDSVDASFHSLVAAGLSPKTRYLYTLRTRGGATASGSFTTAPPDDSTSPFTFLVYGDNRTDATAHAGVVREMQKTPSDFLVNTGDFVTKGSDAASWQTFFDVETPMLGERCVFGCVGNHELYDDAAGVAWSRYFGRSDTGGKLYFSFRWGDARFFFLNAFEDFTAGQRAWLDAELSKADTEGGLAWRFVVLHQGLWSSGPHGAAKQLVAMDVPALLARHHVDLVVSGHDHIYERGDAAGTRYVVSGGGGAPLYPHQTELASTRKFESAFHFVEVTVAPDKVTLVAHRADGSILERCGFSRAPGWDCDATEATAGRSNEAPAAGGAAPATGATGASRCGCTLPGVRATPGAAAGGALLVLATTLFRRRRRAR